MTTSKTDPLDNADDNANEVTETKHNNKSEPDTTPKKQAVVCHADTDRKKNGTIAEARENYKFDVRKTLNFKTIYVMLYFHASERSSEISGRGKNFLLRKRGDCRQIDD